ncbi:MAG TPA: hypothetical protein VFV86_05055, partial [Nitrososphaeraceae archaeon]|nr:hypothetical protein [Nitrososphaeraceae archaeon]
MQKKKSYNNKTIGELSGKHWSEIKYKAIKRNIEFAITQEFAWNLFLKQNRKCALSGIDLFLAIYLKKENNKDIYNSSNATLDRIDSSKDYTE